jgi:alpha/beta hydrolase fold
MLAVGIAHGMARMGDMRRLLWLVLASLLLGGCGTSPTTAPSAAASLAPVATSAALDGLVTLADGRKLDVHCTGSGGPVVMLIAGLGNLAADVWWQVQLGLRDATLCAYDRAGLGESDPAPGPHGAGQAADDLHALLAAAHLPTPVIVVGASYGGLVAQLFARHWPAETLGVVLVDSLAPGWDAGLEDGSILSPAQIAARRAIPNGEPVTNDEIRASEAAITDAPPFPAVPLVVLHHGRPFPGEADWPTEKVEALWTRLQEGLAKDSPTSALLLASRSGHRIHQDQPALVIDAIEAIVDPSRWPPTVADPSPGAPSSTP